MATIDQFLLQAVPPPSALPPSAAPPATGTQTQQPSTPPAAGGGGGGFGGANQLWIFGFVFIAMYFLMIRPQAKKQKEQQAWLSSLKKGDEVVTNGGLVGRITGLTDNFVTLEVQEKVRLKVLRSAVSGKPPEPKADAKAAAQTAPETDKK